MLHRLAEIPAVCTPMMQLTLLITENLWCVFISDLEVNMNGFADSHGTGRLLQVRLEGLKQLDSSFMNVEGNIALSELEGQ